MKLKTIQTRLQKLDPNLKPDDEEFKTAVVMLASANNDLKTAKELAEFTGYPARFVSTVLRRLKQNNIGWSKDGTFHHGGWFDKETGGIAFWMDVCVGQGWMRRA